MSTISVYEAVTLDGVMQAPGRPDEDERGGFTHGGWAAVYRDDVLDRLAASALARSTALLLGQRTYADLVRHRPAAQPSPCADALTRLTTYVVSRDASTDVEPPHGVLLLGDAAVTVRRLKETTQGELTVFGSGELVRALDAAGLVDQYVLLVHPVLLGSGHRLFADEHRKDLHLAEVTPTTTGVLACRYTVA